VCSWRDNDHGESEMSIIRLFRATQYRGYVFAVCAASIYGLMAVLGKMITTEFASPMIVSAFSLLSGLFITGVIFGKKSVSNVVGRSMSGYLYMLGAGCASAFGVSCWYLALSKAPVVLVTPIIAVNPLVTIGLSFLFLKGLEKVTRRTIWGALLVVFGVVLISLGSID